ncbi:ATP-binding protein [Bifidobacterium stellenboschense]|uniref:Sensor histidine kinase n=1 Tax=Bifidobacterium stellenboschense TaxID=762211 RepID=A0A087DIA0_9BIFI|nr:ATP-binding protein [Bifidobacterium stellenboschense]KFI95250.1 Sensor histidine kinase [Bifidobacterium stellenboschense]
MTAKRGGSGGDAGGGVRRGDGNGDGRGGGGVDGDRGGGIAAVGRRVREILGWRCWTIPIALAALALSASQWRVELMGVQDWAWPKLLMQLVIVASTALFAVVPSASSVLTIAAYSIDVLLPDPYLESNGWCLAIALGYIAYRARVPLTIGVLGYLIGMKWLEMTAWSGGLALNMLVPLNSTYIAAVIIGLMARRQTELAALRRQAMRMRQVERNLDVAHQLHDATSGELTSISLMARLGIQDAASERQRELFADIVARAGEALEHVHRIIRILAEDGGSREAGGDARGESGVRADGGGVEGELGESGDSGAGRVGDRITGTGDTADMVAAVLRELTANIARYGGEGGRCYTLDVDASGRGVDIVQTNPMDGVGNIDESGNPSGIGAGWGGSVDQNIVGTPVALPQGHGLALLQHRVEACGGVMTVSAEAGVWRVRVHVPFAGAER